MIGLFYIASIVSLILVSRWLEMGLYLYKEWVLCLVAIAIF